MHCKYFGSSAFDREFIIVRLIGSVRDLRSRLELVTTAADATDAADAAEVVSRIAAPTPPSTRARGQEDDGSYTNSLK